MHCHDAYVKFFRWATDRLQGRDGVVCFVTNNSFVDQFAFDGMRKHYERILRKFIILIYMAMCAKTPNFQVQHIMYLVFKLEWVLLLLYEIRRTLQENYITIEYQNIGERWKN